MKGFLVFVTVTCLMTQVFCVRPHRPYERSEHIGHMVKEVVRPSRGATRVGLDYCIPCIHFAENSINALLNIILNMGVIGTCGTLCELLEEETGSSALAAACNIACDIVGFKEFVKAIEKADLDPIYYCELLTVCPIKDNGDCRITTLEVVPQVGPQGDFTIEFEYVSKNGTGTGEIVVAIDTVDKIPLGQAFLHEQAAPGTYVGRIKVDAEPDPSCNPARQQCERWEAGNYTVKLAVCNGECGSKHPHSQIYAVALTEFEITK